MAKAISEAVEFILYSLSAKCAKKETPICSF
jgi:hypothetical protein